MPSEDLIRAVPRARPTCRNFLNSGAVGLLGEYFVENFKLPAISKKFNKVISLATYVRSHTHVFL